MHGNLYTLHLFFFYEYTMESFGCQLLTKTGFQNDFKNVFSSNLSKKSFKTMNFPNYDFKRKISTKEVNDRTYKQPSFLAEYTESFA